MASAAQLASFADETPEGRSIVVLAKDKYGLRGRELAPHSPVFIPFSAQTRMSGVDMVTASASGLDPNISPAAAEFQIPRVARERHVSEAELRELVAKHTLGRLLEVLGEPRVNVLELNLELDATYPKK
ncbi:MAG: potassium-transporting ATPase subunit C [Candidatus Acidiferrum sp.]